MMVRKCQHIWQYLNKEVEKNDDGKKKKGNFTDYFAHVNKKILEIVLDHVDNELEEAKGKL